MKTWNCGCTAQRPCQHRRAYDELRRRAEAVIETLYEDGCEYVDGHPVTLLRNWLEHRTNQTLESSGGALDSGADRVS